MDQKKVEACKSKLRILTIPERYSCLYQWVLTKNIRLDEFICLVEYLRDLPILQTPVSKPTAGIGTDWPYRDLDCEQQTSENVKYSPFNRIKLIEGDNNG